MGFPRLFGVHTQGGRRRPRSSNGGSAPLLWRSELRSVLTGDLRQRLLSFEQAASPQREAEDQLSGLEFEVASLDVLELATKPRCSACDCEYVALAMHLDVPLVTMDRQILRTFPERAVSLSDT